MPKHNYNAKHIFIELIAWYGVVAIIGAYALISFSTLKPESFIYQFLNFTAALGLISISIVKGVKQSVITNFFWASIALIAMLRIILKF